MIFGLVSVMFFGGEHYGNMVAGSLSLKSGWLDHVRKEANESEENVGSIAESEPVEEFGMAGSC